MLELSPKQEQMQASVSKQVFPPADIRSLGNLEKCVTTSTSSALAQPGNPIVTFFTFFFLHLSLSDWCLTNVVTEWAPLLCSFS